MALAAAWLRSYKTDDRVGFPGGDNAFSITITRQQVALGLIWRNRASSGAPSSEAAAMLAVIPGSGGPRYPAAVLTSSSTSPAMP